MPPLVGCPEHLSSLCTTTSHHRFTDQLDLSLERCGVSTGLAGTIETAATAQHTLRSVWSRKKIGQPSPFSSRLVRHSRRHLPAQPKSVGVRQVCVSILKSNRVQQYSETSSCSGTCSRSVLWVRVGGVSSAAELSVLQALFARDRGAGGGGSRRWPAPSGSRVQGQLLRYSSAMVGLFVPFIATA